MIKRIVQYIIALSCVVAIGQIPITGLPPAQLPLTGTEQVPMVQNNQTVQSQINNIVPPTLTTAPFVVVNPTPALSQSRNIVGGTGIGIADGGAGHALTITNTSPVSSLTQAQVVSLWTPPCNTGSLYLAGNGTCSNPSTPPGAPTTSVQFNNGGVFGGDANFTWTTGVGATIKATVANTNPFLIDASGQTNGGTHYAQEIIGANPNGNAGGLEILTGNTAGDNAIWISNAFNSNLFFQITGVGGGILGNYNNGGELVWNNLNAFTLGPAVAQDSLTVTGQTGHWAETVKSATSSGNSYGLQIQGGTTSGDQAFLVRAATGTPPNLFQINGDGSGSLVSSTTPQLTWDNNATFQSVSNSTTRANFTIDSPANQNGIYIQGSATTGASYGMGILAGTNITDLALNVGNAAGSALFERLYGDGHGAIGPSITVPLGMSWNTAGGFLINAPNNSSTASLEVDGFGTALFVKQASGATGEFIYGGTPIAGGQLFVVNQNGGNTLESLNADGSGSIGRNNSPLNGFAWTTSGAFTMQGATSAPELTINSPSGQFGEIINGNATANASNGLQIFAGTSTSDSALQVYNQANTNQFMDIYGNGSGFLGPTTSHNLSWNGNGAFTVNAPTSGAALTVNGVSNPALQINTPTGGNGLVVNFNSGTGVSYGLVVDSPAATQTAIWELNQSGQSVWQMYEPASDSGIRLWNANSGDVFRITNTGLVTIPTPSAAPPGNDGVLTVNGAANNYTETLYGSSTTGQSDGLNIQAGSTAADRTFRFNNQANNFNVLSGLGTGAVQTGAASSGVTLVGSGSFATAFQLGNAWLGTYTYPSGANLYIASNSYYDGTDYTYQIAQTMGLYVQNNGSSIGHQFYTAPSAAAGSHVGGNLIENFRIGPSAINGRGAQAAGLVDMTPDTASFTGTLTGVSSGGSGTVQFRKMGNIGILYAVSLTGTSNTTAMTMTGLPAYAQPSSAQNVTCNLLDGGNNVLGYANVTNSGTITFAKFSGTTSQFASTNFTASGSKGLNGTIIVYSLNYIYFLMCFARRRGRCRPR